MGGCFVCEQRDWFCDGARMTERRRHMPKYWCVNFEDDAAFVHGIKNKLWSMGYQYGDDDSANRIGRIRLNWQRLEEVKPGDTLVAYRKTNGFFTTGTVRTPKRTKRRDDRKDTISAYLDRRESYDDGYIYFTGTVVYENFTDGLSDYPVRTLMWSHGTTTFLMESCCQS